MGKRNQVCFLYTHRTFPARCNYPIQAQTKRGDVALLGHFNRLPGQRFGLAIKKRLGGHCRSIARARTLAGRVATHSVGKRSPALGAASVLNLQRSLRAVVSQFTTIVRRQLPNHAQDIEIWIAISIAIGYRARERGRDFLDWTTLSLLISPVIARIRGASYWY